MPPPLRGNLAFNLRTLAAPQSGVQRYAGELDLHFAPEVLRLAPARPALGMMGHLWEQFILPVQCRGRLLFSPGNTGPLLYRRQVVTIHDASTFDCTGAFTGLFGRWYRWLLPQLAQRALGVITVSNFSRDRLVATLGIAPEKITVVHNGVTPPPAALDPRSLAEAKKRLKLPTRFLLFIGSRDPRKNLARLIAAFAESDLPDLHLVVAGGGNAQLFAPGHATPVHERVTTLGYVDEPTLECLYQMAEGFVFPSLYEGFGLPPLEAMARGCPVLCSDTTCLPEVCGPALADGGAPLYFSPGSVASIAATLRHFHQLPAETRAQMAAAGRKRAACFTWDRCAAETAEALAAFATAGAKQSSPVAPSHLLNKARKRTP